MLFSYELRIMGHLVQGQGHLEGPHGVHVGSNDRDSSVAAFGVSEAETPHEVNLGKVKAGEGGYCSFVHIETQQKIKHGRISITSLRDLRVLRLGRSRTSLKSSLTSFSMRGILVTD